MKMTKFLQKVSICVVTLTFCFFFINRLSSSFLRVEQLEPNSREVDISISSWNYEHDDADDLANLPQNVKEEDRKVILLGSLFFSSPFKGFDKTPQACRVTSNKSEQWTADAVLFHALDEPATSFNPMIDSNRSAFRKLNKEQVWIGLMYEAPESYPIFFGYYNWSMTFRRDSDIYSPYNGKFTATANKNHSMVRLEPAFEHYRKHKIRKKHVAWVVSNCADDNLRMSYAEELARYIPVDIFGACSTQNLQCGSREKLSDRDCWEFLSKNYKFYLSFESRFCKDYITEKLHMPLYYGILPIVYGGSSKADYSAIAPPHSFVDSRNFESPRKLAEYLWQLDADPDLYEEYFGWRQYFNVEYNRSFLGQDVLCAKLWDLDRHRKPASAEKFQEWWDQGSCTKPFWLGPNHGATLLAELIILSVILFGLFHLATLIYIFKCGSRS